MFELLQMGERSDLEDTSIVPREFPLFFDGSERMRFRYAIFLLNKACCQKLLHSFSRNTVRNLLKFSASVAFVDEVV